VIAPGDVDTLARHFDTLADDRALRAAMSAASLRLIEPWSYETGVDGVVAALNAYGRRS
jgi:hypothetical protein